MTKREAIVNYGTIIEPHYYCCLTSFSTEVETLVPVLR